MADKWVELSDDQIEQLLLEAEARLSAQEKDGKSLSNPSKSEAEANTSKTNAVATTTTVLKATQPTSSERKSKEELSVRIPEIRKRMQEKVYIILRFSCTSTFENFMMKIISQFH